MRSIVAALACVVFMTLINGCASSGKLFPSDPKDQVPWYMNQIDKQAQDGNYKRVSVMLAGAIKIPGGVEAAKDLFIKSPSIKINLSEYIEQTSEDTPDKGTIVEIAEYIFIFGRSGLIRDPENTAFALNARIGRGNALGEFSWLLCDDISNFPVLQSAENQKIIFERTLAKMSDQQRPQGLAQSLAEYLSNSERSRAELSYAQDKLSAIILRRPELQAFQEIYPDLVESKLAELVVNVQIVVSPSDRLMEEDLKEKLGQISSNYVILKNGDQCGAKTIKVIIEKLRFDEKQLPTQSETITYAQHDVDLFKGALLMPRGASFMYEWTRGGVELEYGYIVRVTQGDRVLLDELLRDTLTEKFVNCNNPRIVNVFGGTTRANFVPNSDMSSKCSGATSLIPSVKDLKNQVMAILVNKVVSVEELAVRK